MVILLKGGGVILVEGRNMTDKKVLLREHKRHTVRRVAPGRGYPLCQLDGGNPPPPIPEMWTDRHSQV